MMTRIPSQKIQHWWRLSLQFFSNLMGTVSIELPFPNIEGISSGLCLSHDQKYRFITPIIGKEIYASIKGMPYDKSPGIDEFLVEFYTQNWSILKQDVLLAVKEFCESGRLLKSFSCTVITLITKVAKPSYVRDYRPIACCTINYKIITRVLTNRMKLVVKNNVNPSQSSFVEGRSIVDNILFSHEIFKWYSRKGLSPRCIMKVDLRKDYDSIEWGF